MRLIDADKLHYKRVLLNDGTQSAVVVFAKEIDKAEKIKAIPIGHWIEERWNDTIICSNCDSHWNILDNDTETFEYCPRCGAKMIDDWEKENETN